MAADFMLILQEDGLFCEYGQWIGISLELRKVVRNIRKGKAIRIYRCIG